MPFITSEARQMVANIGPKEVGDRCFIFYRDMLRAWRASPRWTTAHEIYKDLIRNRMLDLSKHAIGPDRDDNIVARDLAWQVFFQLHVIPYELGKRTINGEVDY